MPDAGHKRETELDRSGAGAADPPRAAPSLAILGADALLAAQPATAVQLAHACLRVGFQAVVPASWGDELIAGACLRRLASRRSTGDAGPAIFCACPYVAHRLLAVGPDLEPFLESFVAPPVALARYLRTLYAPARIRLTYMGRCPGAADETIDARLTPDELLAVLVERGIVLADQPRAFDSVIPPDRRRYLSQPGGLPAVDVLRRMAPERRLVELTDPELAIELAQELLSKSEVLLDAGTRLGCACSGAVGEVRPEEARARVTALEPPRAPSRVVDDRVPVPLELPLPAVVRTPIDVARAAGGGRRAAEGGQQAETNAASASAQQTAQATLPAPTALGFRRRSPTHGVAVRPHAGAIPTTRSGEGRALPRAYVAHRRGAPPRGRGVSTPPQGGPAQTLDASGGRGAGNGGGPRGGGSAAPPPLPSPSAFVAPSGEVAVNARAPLSVRAPAGPPNQADDPHGIPFNIPNDVVEEAARAAADLRTPAPISEVTVTGAAAAFRTRATQLARLAVSAARRRRTTLTALLAVALLSATVGVVAGRWMAGRGAVPAGTTK